jgi:hypothetical protein
MRVHRQRLAGRDREVLSVELRRVVDEAAMAHVRGAGSGPGIEEPLEIPAAIGGELADRVSARGHQPPQILRRPHLTRVPAADSHDRDRLACAHDRRRPCLVGALACDLGDEPRRQHAWARVVEEQRPGEREAGGLHEAVAHLDGRRRVDAELLERPRRVQGLG